MKKKNAISKTKKMQKGRSMIEMLGVLAVIAVLTIGGIFGYRLAMDKYAANETINELNLRAFTAAHIINRGGRDLTIGDFGDTTRMGYGIQTDAIEDDAYLFEIALSDVPNRVCQQIVSFGWFLPTGIWVNEAKYEGNADICDSGSLAAMTFEFDATDVLGGDFDADVGEEETDDVNTETAPETLTGTGIDECDDVQPLRDMYGQCHSCTTPQNVIIGTDKGACSVCSNRIAGAISQESGGEIIYNCRLRSCASNSFQDHEGNCYSCSGTTSFWYYGDAASCSAQCPNRKVLNLGDGSVTYRYFECGVESAITTATPETTTPETTAPETTAPETTTEEDTATYETTTLFTCAGGLSPMVGSWDSRLNQYTYYCVDCDIMEAISYVADVGDGWRANCFDACSNRKPFHEDYRTCALKTCPSSHPLRKDNGDCVACSSTSSITIAYQDTTGFVPSCDGCPNMRLESYTCGSGICYDCVPK